MITPHLPLAATAALGWDGLWPESAILATALVLLATVVFRHAVVWRRLHRATAALDAARERFQWLAENVSDVVMQVNNDEVVQWITPSVTARIGRPQEEIVGRPFIALVHPDDRGRVAALDHQLQRCPFVETSVRLLISDGGYRWFSLAVRPLFDASGAAIGRICGAHDIEREVQARDAAEAERRRLNATLESLFDPHVVVHPVRDAGGRILDFIFDDANPAACGWVGMNRDNLMGTRLLEVYPSTETSGLLKILADTADTGRPAAVDAFQFPLGTAGFRWIDIRAVRVDERVSFTWRDVTDRDDVTKKLAASEEQFRLLAENSSDVVVRVGAGGKIMWVSPAVTPVLGWSQEDWVGHLATDFFSSTADRERFLHEQQKAAVGQSITVRAQMQAKGGDVHWAEIHAGPYRTEGVSIDGIAASFRLVDAEVSSQRILERRARTDELTGLLNRKEVIERMESLNRHEGCKIAVLWCDIDRFKVVNDTYGHAAGDTVLKALADRIRGALRTTDDLAARIGGDELLVLLNGVHDLQDAVDSAEQLRCSAAEPIPTAVGPVNITLSIGVTLAHPDEGTDALIARADDAMYQAKNSGRNQVVAIADAEASLHASSVNGAIAGVSPP